MTRQEIIERLERCQDPIRCMMCELHDEDTSICLNDIQSNLVPSIIHELQRIDKLMTFCEKMKDWHYKKSQEHKRLDYFRLAQQEDALAGVYIRIMNELKGGEE